MAGKSQFEVVEETGDVVEFPSEKRSLDITALTLALKALSQRALIAIDNLFTLVTVALVFWLWRSVPDPNTLQLIGLGMFAVFVLAANVIVRRK